MNDAIRAYHEAGHAVVARALGLGIPYVKVLRADVHGAAHARTECAHWSVRGHDPASQIAALEKDAKVDFAGAQAQHRYRPVKNVKRAQAGVWSKDIADAQSTVCRIVLLRAGIDLGDDPTTVTLTERQLDSCNDLLAQQWKESAALVEANWPAIERVAEALLVRVLNQDDVDALIAHRPLWMVAS